jgi:H+/gluconate symporter-like permease
MSSVFCVMIHDSSVERVFKMATKFQVKEWNSKTCIFTLLGRVSTAFEHLVRYQYEE